MSPFSWNLARERAREALADLPAWQVGGLSVSGRRPCRCR
jgi:hypothetical protein